MVGVVFLSERLRTYDLNFGRPRDLFRSSMKVGCGRRSEARAGFQHAARSMVWASSVEDDWAREQVGAVVPGVAAHGCGFW